MAVDSSALTFLPPDQLHAAVIAADQSEAALLQRNEAIRTCPNKEDAERLVPERDSACAAYVDAIERLGTQHAAAKLDARCDLAKQCQAWAHSTLTPLKDRKLSTGAEAKDAKYSKSQITRLPVFKMVPINLDFRCVFHPSHHGAG